MTQRDPIELCPRAGANFASLSSVATWRLALFLFVATLVTLGTELNRSRLASLLLITTDAYWLVALGLLGFGIGGASVAVSGERLGRRIDGLLPCFLVGIGLSSLPH
jgi:hypothetical protein